LASGADKPSRAGDTEYEWVGGRALVGRSGVTPVT